MNPKRVSLIFRAAWIWSDSWRQPKGGTVRPGAPGPYICAEWDFGGLPAWLLRERDLRLRCSDPRFLGHVADYFRVLLPKLLPLQCSRGGNLLALQVENEYGSYGNDKTYLRFLRDLIRSCGVEVPLFTSDGPASSMLSGGTVEGAWPTVNFGSGADKAFQALERLSGPGTQDVHGVLVWLV